MQESSDRKTWDVVGVGASSVDTVTVLPAWPQPHGSSAKMRIRSQHVCSGGQTATALATCASFGLRACYAGAIGDDDNGRRVRSALAERGVDVTHAIVRAAPNQHALILLDETSGERIVLWERDDRLSLDVAEIPVDVLTAARVIHVDDVDQRAAIRAASVGRERGITVTSDLDRMTDDTGALVAAVTVPIFAEHLTQQLSGERDQERALRKLRRHHAGLLVVTLGRDGAIALDGDRLHVAPAFPVNAIDTTGAGDVFRGALIYGLLQDWPVDRMLRFANGAAAVSCTRLGAMNGVPTLGEASRMAGD
jgi:sugar/nucleoside kinase (ribokinase family)